MKHLILTLALLLSCSLLALAQRGISYQAVILDPKPIEIPGQDITGQPFVNGEVSLKFKLFSATFVQEFEEVHAAKTDAYGLVNVLIGSINPGAFSALVWDNNPRSMQVWVSFDQGGTYTKVSEQVLTYNPYSLYSETAGSAGKLAGTLGIAAGGTGATTAANARTNLGLGNVDNTSDANKPISSATQAVLDAKANANEVTTALGTKANAAEVSASLGLKEDVSNKANTPLGSSTTLYPTQNAVKTYVDTQVAGATIADASANTKGKIQLAGDLSGTAAAPTVPGLALKANASDVSASLNLKANAADMATELNLKATSADLTAGLALKLDSNQKGVANGLATLNSSGVIPSSQLPPITLSSTTVVANATEMLGLSSAIVGSIAIRTDVAKNFVLRALPASTVGNWIELLTPAAPVQTVNGYTGSVNLAKSDLGLGNVDNTADASKPISNAAQQALDLKSNAAEVNAALATKLNTTDALAALNLKANAADVNAGLATKLNTADATAALNLKSNTADVAAALNLKLDAIKVGIANGTASLDALGKIPTNQIPAISFSSVNVLGSQAEMLALTTAVVGSVVIRTDVNKNYVLAQANPSLLANWIELLTPAPPVQTVNGYTGTVSLTKSDLGLGNVDNTSDANKPISTATQTALDGKVSDDFVAAAVTAGNAANTAAIVTLNSSVATTTQSIAATNLALAQKAPLFKPLKNAEYVMPTSGTITDANSGNIIYSQWSQKPVFPESLSDGFYCTIVNYSGGTITSNTLSTARFYTNTSGYAGSTTFTIPPGGSANVYAVKINGIQRYYVSAGDQSSTFSVANGSITNAKLAGSIAASKLVGTDISSVGTVTTGTWNATAIGLTYGGTGATNAADARTNLGLVIGTNVQAPLAAGTDYLSPNGSAANLTNFPTLNQNTTGNAATATLATTASNVSGLISGANGGTGVANSGKTITLGGNFQTGHAINFTTTGSTTLSLPVSGTLATVQQVDAKAPLASPALTGTPTAPTAAVADNSTKIATTEFVQAAVSAGNAGLRTIGAISTTSNAKGAVISGTSELVLTPADASNGGIVTTGTQTFAGSKTFANNLVSNGTLTAGAVTYPNAHGTANQVLSTTGSGTLTWTTPASVTMASLLGTQGANTFLAGPQTNLVTLASYDGSTLAGWTTSGAGIASDTGTGNPSSSFKTTGGNQYMYRSFVGQNFRNKTIQFDVKLTSGKTGINIGTAENAGDGGLGLTLFAGSNSRNGFTGSQSWLYTDDGGDTYTFTPGTWYTIKIITDNGAAGGTSWYVNGALVGTSGGYGIGAGTYFGIASDNGTAHFDNLTISGVSNASDAVPTFRALVPADFPTLNQNTTGNAATATLATTASNVSGLVSGANGGTGVANTGKTITLGGNFETGHAINFTTTGSSTLALPVSGTLATVQQVDSKAPLVSPALTGTPTAPTATSGDNSTKIATTEFVQTAVSAGNAGLRTIGAISATSNAKGAVISGTSELVLTPADASNGGVVTTGTQTFAGSKTFANKLIINSGTAGGASLEVNGASTNTTAFNAASGTSIDFTKSNLAYTTASAGNFTLTGMKDGGTYTLAVQGASSGTAAFSGSNPSAVSLTFKSVNNAATTANKHTLYTFIVMGTTVYYSMMTGL